jgi:hypothetical protein
MGDWPCPVFCWDDQTHASWRPDCDLPHRQADTNSEYGRNDLQHDYQLGLLHLYDFRCQERFWNIGFGSFSDLLRDIEFSEPVYPPDNGLLPSPVFVHQSDKANVYPQWRINDCMEPVDIRLGRVSRAIMGHAERKYRCISKRQCLDDCPKDCSRDRPVTN